MKNLSLRAKLFIVLGMLSVVAMAIAFVGITRLGRINDSLNQVVSVTSTKQMLSNQMRRTLLAIHRAEKNHILSQTREEMDRHAESMQTFEKELSDQKTKLLVLMTEAEKQRMKDFDKAYEAYKQIQEKARENSEKNTNMQAFELSRGAGRDIFLKGERLLEGMAERNTKRIGELIAGLKAASDSEEVKNKLGTVDESAMRAVLVTQAAENFVSMQRAEKNMILEPTTEGMQNYIKETQDRYAKLNECLTEAERTATEEGKKDIAAIRSAVGEWMENNKKVVALSTENSNEIARKLSGNEGRAAIEAAEAVMAKISEEADRDMSADAKAAQDLYASARVLMICVSVIGILAAVGLGFSIITGVIRSVKSIFKGLRTLSTAELEQTQAAFGRIIDGLDDGVAQVNDAAGQVSSASQSLAEGASEQASSLEETSSALEQMAAMTRTNAANAAQANDLSLETSRAAEQGEQTMKDINASSDQISKIIKVIEEIAFQTNLLALNAAVEAARAGEHGKGFAVVADEVRNLAQRAAQAAKETTSLIENSVNKSREGMAAIEAIVGGVNKVKGLLEGIAKASQEQAQGVDQVNVAVAQMDKVTQQNASASEESASAAEELNAQAEATKGLVDELILMVRGQTNRGRHVSAVSKKAAIHDVPASAATSGKHASRGLKSGSAIADGMPDLSCDAKDTLKDF